MRIGLVLAGGGGRGAYHIGVWKALRETGLDGYVSAISGTSVGGLNAALFLQGDLRKAEEIWKNLSTEKILTPRGSSQAQLQHSAYEPEKHSGLYLYIRNGLLKIIEENLDMSVFDESEKNCYMTCYRTQDKKAMDNYEEMFTRPDGTKECKTYINGNVTYFNMRGFSNADRIKILLATSAMPFIFPQEQIGGYYYMDGGWADNLPVEPLYQIEKCNVIVVVHLTTNDGKIDREKFPNATILEIRPEKEQGGLFAGILDFHAQSAADRIQQGYYDTIERFQEIKKSVDRETASGEQLKEVYEDKMPENEIDIFVKSDKDYSEMEKKIKDLTKGWSTDEMIELLVECEMVLSHNEGRIKQLNVKGLKRLWRIITGINAKITLTVHQNVQEIQKISFKIQKILLQRVDLMKDALISLKECTLTAKSMIYRLFQKFEGIQQNVDDAIINNNLTRWYVCAKSKKTDNGKRYLDVSDGMKILLVVSDLFQIVHERNDLIKADELETPLHDLGLNKAIKNSDFYGDIIKEKECLPLYVKDYYDYQTENISSHGQMIHKVAEFYSNPLLGEMSEFIEKPLDELCQQIISKKLKNINDGISPADLCLELLGDLKCLNSKFQEKAAKQAPLEETLLPGDEYEDVESNQTEYSILKLTPEELHLFREQDNVRYDLNLNRKEAYVFKDEKMLGAYIESSSPYMVTASSYFGQPEPEPDRTSEIKELLSTKEYVPLADYYMYLWFRYTDKEKKTNRKLAFIEYYGGAVDTVYVSVYAVNASGDNYKKDGLITIPGKRSIYNMVTEIQSHTYFSGSKKDDILIFQTFDTDEENLYKLKRDYKVKMVDSAWENILKETDNGLENAIQDMMAFCQQ